jgi:hypothetical protein
MDDSSSEAKPSYDQNVWIVIVCTKLFSWHPPLHTSKQIKPMYQKRVSHLTICRNIACLLLGGFVLLLGITEARYAYSTDSQHNSMLKQLALYGVFLKSTRP